ncbi:hypothetical protein GHT06_018296 [Daphnia sinensis]|uniref:Uncharacterized protein n=1 Tax=Daphnia sinensis TaxID=1820382 RepID=A0AAD5PUM4_9CRUS|nr:hypothetical protein GHT06_018296 [Daphnia sinensis]
MDGCCLSNRARRFVLCLSPFIRDVSPPRTTTDSFVPFSRLYRLYSSAFIT